jgi:hypothetical protein
MSNASNLSTLANVLDDGTSGQFLKSTGSGGVAFDTVAAGAVVYDTADLLPLSGNSAGDMAYVTATNRFYINNGSGWYSVSLVNTNPNITSVQDAGSNTTPFTLATDQTATVITITAADPEEVPLTYGYSVTSGSLNGSTVAQGTGNNTNVFTVTPHASQDATFTLTFTASDGINQATSANAFSLSFVADWTNLSQTQMLQSGDSGSTGAGDQYGRHLVLTDDELFVGAYAAGGNYQGRLYVYTKSGSTWSQSQVLVGSDTANQDQFGFNVDVDGDYLLVTAKEDTNNATNAGAGYIFHKSGNTWSQQAKLIASTAANYDSAGESCAISGDTAVLGSPWGEPPGSSINAAGEAFVFVRSGTSWSEQARINPTNINNDYLTDIDIDGDTIVIGSTGNNSSTSGGAVYVYTRSGTSWSLQQKITSNNAAVANAGWGEQVKINGDTLVASCGYYTSGSGTTGNVEVWTRSGTSWSFQATLTPNPTDTSGTYGRSLSIDGDTVAVGNYSYSSNQGRAVIFQRTGTSWSQKKVLAASTPVANTNFGYGVSVHETSGQVAIGASSFSSSPTSRAYVFNA